MTNPKFSSLRYKSIVEYLLKLNKKFRLKKLSLGDSFYKQLEVFGCEIDKSFIVEIFPDSGSTYAGTIINQYMQILDFDIDTDYPEYTRISETTELSETAKIALEILQTLSPLQT